MEDMGFPILGFSGGRKDIWALEEDIYWGGEETWLDDSRRHERAPGTVPEAGTLEKPLGASQMGLIYVNPEVGSPGIFSWDEDDVVPAF